MNNEFQWRNEMRKLGGSIEPARDLWPAIAASIRAAPVAAAPARRQRHLRWMAMAATLVVAVGAGTLVYRAQHIDATPVAPVAPALSQADTHVAATTVADGTGADELPRTALDWAIPADPQLARTAQSLDTASAQLQEALEQRPDAVFLVGLLNRTNAQRLRLMRKSPYAG
jgi:non-ribosomal peptide synthetase component F